MSEEELCVCARKNCQLWQKNNKSICPCEEELMFEALGEIQESKKSKKTCGNCAIYSMCWVRLPVINKEGSTMGLSRKGLEMQGLVCDGWSDKFKCDFCGLNVSEKERKIE